MKTPLEHYPSLASKIGVKGLYFKREDLQHFGSHKGRSIPVMIDHYMKLGDKRFAISSSGNAALAAALYVKELNSNSLGIDLDIFVGNHISPLKLAKLNKVADDRIRVLLKERPLQALTQAAQEGLRSLRQSTDDEALAGYTSLAEEIAEIKDVKAVFIGTSSGTTAQALAQYFVSKNLPIQVHIIQTPSCHPIADGLETYDGPDEQSAADAIVDHIAHRKSVLVPLISKTGGHAWVATNELIEAAQKMTEDVAKQNISTNSALSVAGAMMSVYEGWDIDGVIVCIISGD